VIRILKARRPPLPPLDARETAVARALVAASRAVAANTQVGKLTDAVNSGNPEEVIGAVNWGAAGEALLSVLPKQYLLTHEDGKQNASRLLRRALGKVKKQVGYDFGYTDPNSVNWAQTQAGALIRQWGTSSQAALRALLVRAFEEGITPAKLARLIRASGIGLTERQALAVLRRRAMLLKDGIQELRAMRMLDRYASQLLRLRAETIARTEIIAAHTAGAQASWAEAVDEGLLNPATARQVWSADPDERTCDICEALDGEEVPLGQPFPGGIMGPPAHPACRCGLNVRP
jgi:SPP1 gp7 family putative phage head morphogenesis protein